MIISFGAKLNKAIDGLYALVTGNPNIVEVEREPLAFPKDVTTFTQHYVLWVMTPNGACYFSAWPRADKRPYSEYYTEDEILCKMLSGRWRRCRNGSATWIEIEVAKDTAINIAQRELAPEPRPPWLEGWPK